VVGWFRTGAYQGHLRVHGRAAGGTDVFAIPLDAIATSGSGLLTLAATGADLPDWLAYLVRRYNGQR
jgi:hypothetical protein